MAAAGVHPSVLTVEPNGDSNAALIIGGQGLYLPLVLRDYQ